MSDRTSFPSHVSSCLSACSVVLVPACLAFIAKIRYSSHMLISTACDSEIVSEGEEEREPRGCIDVLTGAPVSV